VHSHQMVAKNQPLLIGISQHLQLSSKCAIA